MCFRRQLCDNDIFFINDFISLDNNKGPYRVKQDMTAAC